MNAETGAAVSNPFAILFVQSTNNKITENTVYHHWNINLKIPPWQTLLFQIILKVPSRHIQSQTISRYEIHGVLFGHYISLTAFSNDHSQFKFMMQIITSIWNPQIITGGAK